MLGFRYGQYGGLQWDEYLRLVSGVDTNPISLQKLFAPGGSFGCFIYMLGVETTDDGAFLPPPFRMPADFTGQTIQDGRRLQVSAAALASSHRNHGRAKEMARPTPHASHQVCTQRWSFSHPTSDGFWVCYRLESPVDHCAQDSRDGQLFSLAALSFLGVAALVLHSQPHFMLVANWLARGVLYLELPFYVLQYMLSLRMNIGRWTFLPMSMALILVVGNLCFLPHWVLSRFEWGRPLAAVFLFAILYSPIEFVDRLSYNLELHLLVYEWPLRLGLFGFSADVLKHLLWRDEADGTVERKLEMVPPPSRYPIASAQTGNEYAPMTHMRQ